MRVLSAAIHLAEALSVAARSLNPLNSGIVSVAPILQRFESGKNFVSVLPACPVRLRLGKNPARATRTL